MSVFEVFPIKNEPSASNMMKALGSNFNNISQALCEFVDNALSNFRGNLSDETLVRKVRIALRKLNGAVDVTVEDGGSGIKNLDNAMTLAGLDAQESPLNEHGFGMKHALAYVEGAGSSWRIFTRTKEDADRGRFRIVEAPYDFGTGKLEGKYSGEPWVGTLGSTGTVIRFLCPMNIFYTLCPDSQNMPSFHRLVEILKENLSFTYAKVLDDGEMQMEVVMEDEKGERSESLCALKPQWVEGETKVRPPREYKLGGGTVTIGCKYGCILPDKKNICHYTGNMETSGAEIRINGRVMEYGLMKQIWKKVPHPSQNAFLAQIDVEATAATDIPATKIAKNGFREEGAQLNELFTWIRNNAPLAKGQEKQEKRLMSKFAEELRREFPDSILTLEKEVFQEFELGVRADLFAYHGGKITVYEGKAKKTTAISVYQLKMYWDGCICDGNTPSEGVLIGSRHPRGVERLVRQINGMIGPDGRPYRLRTMTWEEAGVSL